VKAKGGRKPALTPQEAIEVRELYAGPGRWTTGSLARSFGVKIHVIQAVLNRTGAYGKSA
jgi:hypothetical protein